MQEHIGKASEGLLPGDKTLILNKKREKDYFLQYEFNIDKLWKVLPCLMYVSPSIRNEETVSLLALQRCPGSLLLAPDRIDRNMNIKITNMNKTHINIICSYI